MAISFREMPWYVLALVYFALAVLIVAGGEMIPGSPVKSARAELAQLNQDQQTLAQQVNSLEVYRRRYPEFKAETEAAQKQLDTLKAIVPEEKDVDEFIRMVQAAAASSGVELRKMTSGTIVAHDYHYDMPFLVELDGPYYGILDFFSRMSRLSRIINVGDLAFAGVKPGEKMQVPQQPGTSVKAQMTLVTFFTKPDDTSTAAPGAKAPAQGKR